MMDEKEKLINLSGLETFKDNMDSLIDEKIAQAGIGVTYTISKNDEGKIVLIGSDKSTTSVTDENTTYTFSEENHVLTITGTDGTSEEIQLGGEITKQAVIDALGFTPMESYTEIDPTVPECVKSITQENITAWNEKADVSDIPTTLSSLTDDATHRVVTDAEKSAWNAKLDSFTETDPTVPAHVKAITEQNISNWNSKAEAGDIPNVPAWALESKKPTYTATEVGADTVGAATSALNNANSYTDKKIADLINGAPETLDTLKEIADAMAEDKKVVEALNTAIGTKVDKVDGKGLSTNDFTAIYKSAIDNLPSSYAPTNAECNVVVGVQVNGTDVTVDSNRKVNITVPTSASDIGAQAALSTAQLNAANSGITSTKVSTYDGYASSISAKYTKPSTGIPASDLASGVIPTSLPASNVTDTYSATGTAPVSGKAVASAISGKANSSDLPGTETTNIDFSKEW